MRSCPIPVTGSRETIDEQMRQHAPGEVIAFVETSHFANALVCREILATGDSVEEVHDLVAKSLDIDEMILRYDTTGIYPGAINPT